MEEVKGLYVPALSKDTYDLVEALWWSYQHEYCHNYSSLEDKTGKDRDEIKELLEPFKKLKLVKYVRGLRTEEGELAGSGFWVNGLGAQQALELALFRYNYNDRPFGQAEDFAPKTIKIGEFEYNLKVES